jgi:uncharacterized protein
MLAVRIAETDPEKQAARQQWFADHQAYLRSGAVRVLQSGPLFAGDVQYGALLVADVADLDELSRFSNGDPFVIHGIYRRVEILRWSRTIG